MRAGRFELSIKIPENTHGRQLVIPDIHGCSKTFKALLKKIQLTKKDQLFLLGDYINKGKHSAAVIDHILHLLEDGYHLLPLRGNHEEMLLKSHRNATKKWAKQVKSEIPRLHGKSQVRGEDGKILPKYRAFFEHLPYYFELENFYLVHAGFNTETQFPFRDYQSMLWTRDFDGDLEKTQGKTVIVGHTPELIQHVYRNLENRSPVIFLDNGCVYKNKWFLGNLLCLDLNSWELVLQKNID